MVAAGLRATTGRRVAVAFGAAVLLAGAGCAAGSSRSATTPAAPSQRGGGLGLTIYPRAQRSVVPPLSGRGLDGRPVSVAKLGQGKIVFLNAWASWCAPCREESPLLARYAVRLAGRGVAFVGLNERDSPSAARAFIAKTGSRYPHLVDDDGALLRKLPMLPQMGVPSTLVIDRHGLAAARVVGVVSAQDIHRILASLTQES